MMEWSKQKRFKFPIVDQSLLQRFFGARFNALPDTYNWKLYWGEPSNALWGPHPEIKIIHFHGERRPQHPKDMTFGPYLAANNRILISLVHGARLPTHPCFR
jgi:hypothetical protein